MGPVGALHQGTIDALANSDNRVTCIFVHLGGLMDDKMAGGRSVQDIGADLLSQDSEGKRRPDRMHSSLEHGMSAAAGRESGLDLSIHACMHGNEAHDGYGAGSAGDHRR